MYAICTISVRYPILLFCNALPVIGLGILVNANKSTNPIVPTKRTWYHLTLQPRNIGIAQNTCAPPDIIKSKSVTGSISIGKLEGLLNGPIIARCNIPASRVVDAAKIVKNCIFLSDIGYILLLNCKSSIMSLTGEAIVLLNVSNVTSLVKRFMVLVLSLVIIEFNKRFNRLYLK